MNYALTYKYPHSTLTYTHIIYFAAHTSRIDAEASLRDLLATANFGHRPINAVVDFHSENLTDLANIPSKDLDLSITWRWIP